MHKDIKISDNANKTLQTVYYYNKSKYGVGVVDQIAKKFTVRSDMRRLPVHSFPNTLGLAAINAWILYKEFTKENIVRRDFIRKLAEELAYPSAQNCNHISGKRSLSKDETHQIKFCLAKVSCKRNRSVGVYSM